MQQFDPDLNPKKSPLAQLRQFFDAESEVTGFQISNKPGPRDTRDAAPEWVIDDEKLREFLLSICPEIASSKPPRSKRAQARYRRACRDAAILYLFYRAGFTDRDIASELAAGEITAKHLDRATEAIAETRRRLVKKGNDYFAQQSVLLDLEAELEPQPDDVFVP